MSLPSSLLQARAPITVELDVVEGASFQRVCTITDANSAAVDLAGLTPACTILSGRPGAYIAAATATCAIVGDGSAGQFTIYLSPTDTAAIGSSYVTAPPDRAIVDDQLRHQISLGDGTDLIICARGPVRYHRAKA